MGDGKVLVNVFEKLVKTTFNTSNNVLIAQQFNAIGQYVQVVSYSRIR